MIEKLKISIIGLGFVGNSIYKSFLLKGLQENIDLFGYDKFKNIGSFEECLQSDIIFLALPTIYKEDIGQYDKAPIYDTCTKLEEHNYKGVIIIKSTVEPNKIFGE